MLRTFGLLVLSFHWCTVSIAQIPSTYQVGTWKDFKTSAVSYTYDDNTANQFPVAIPLMDSYNFPATMFVVSGQMNGEWGKARAAAANGHEIASHTITHDDMSESSLQQQESELSDSKNTINSEIPLEKCVTIAYPYCNIGDAGLVADYYISGRTCSGQINANNPSDFYRISSYVVGDQGINTASGLNDRVNAARTAEGWCVFLMHAIDGDGGYSPIASSDLDSHFGYVKQNESDYWVGTFGAVTKYIKERNALSISETAVGNEQINIVPTDNLGDDIYDQAVTIRRQVPAGWQGASVTLNGSAVAVTEVTAGNTAYFQFDVLPDAGTYVLASGASADPVISEPCDEVGEGAYFTGNYRNLFNEILGKSTTEINSKVEAAFQQIFYGGSNEKLYYEVGNDMAYMLDVNNNDVRTEGMSYGMMICVQLDKKTEFDKLWRWAKTYMQYDASNSYDGYFAWQLNTDGTIKGNGPASDGEAYFITSLFFAANRWGNGSGILDYNAQAQDILDRVSNKTGAGNVYNLFNTSSKQITFVPYGDSYNYTDPSYHIPGFWELWGRWSDTNTAFWEQTPQVSRDFLQDASHPTSGLTADYSEFDGTPKAVSFNTDADRFMYDAWRTAMNIGMDYHWFKADPQQPVIAERYLTFFKNQGSGYKNHYDWDGSNPSGEHSTGLVSCNAVAALAVDNVSLTQPFVQEFWDVGIPTGTYRYYDGMLYMLALLNCSGDFKVWKPECDNACATPAPSVEQSVTYEVGETADQLAADGASLLWYLSAAGGVGTSAAPFPSTDAVGTFSFYVSQTLNDCEGPRAQITVVVSNTYKIYRAGLAPELDGVADDHWQHASVESISAENEVVASVTSAADLSGQIRFLWDSDHLYFLAEVVDDALNNDSEKSYEDDAIEIYLDPNNGKSATYQDDDVQYAFGWDDGAVVGALPADRAVTGIVYAVLTTSDGYNIEGSIPWSTLSSIPSVDQLIGLDFMVNDDDDGTGRDGKLSWNAASDDAWQDASLFGTAKLVGDLPCTQLSNPSVEISAEGGTMISSTSNVVINALDENGGFNASYAWYKNDQLIPGQNDATLQANGVTFGDAFYSVLSSSAVCVAPRTTTSNTLYFDLFTQVLDDEQSTFSIRQSSESPTVLIEGLNLPTPYRIYAISGAQVQSGTTQDSIDFSSLSRGQYVLKLDHISNSSSIRIVRN